MILPGNASESIATCVDVVRAGGLFGLPTETVYGLGADADNDAAVAQIFVAKGRPADHPLIVHVADAAGAVHYAACIPDFAAALMAAFWPGPLTLILPRRPGVASAAAGGQGSIGLRCPSHPVAQALLKACAAVGVYGVAAPSANQFGRVSPTTAEHVAGEFGPDLLILDGGPCSVGIESTIIDCTRGQPVLLRPGAITADQVQAACGLRVRSNDELSAQALAAPRASGTLASHYAPRAKVRLMDASALQTALELLGHTTTQPDKSAAIGVYGRVLPVKTSGHVCYRRMPDDAASTAQQLFAVLRDFDAQGVQVIWIETPPDTPAWAGVRDRLRRAAS